MALRQYDPESSVYDTRTYLALASVNEVALTYMRRTRGIGDTAVSEELSGRFTALINERVYR